MMKLTSSKHEVENIIWRLETSLNQAKRFEQEIIYSYNSCNSKENVIQTLEGQLDSLNRDLDQKKREKENLNMK